MLVPIFVLCVFSVWSSAEIDVKEKCDGTCEKQLCDNQKDILTLHLQIVSQNVRIAEQNSQIERQNVDIQKQNVHIHKQNTKIEQQNSKLMELRFKVDALSVTVQHLEGKRVSAPSPGKQGKKCSAPSPVSNANFISSSYSVGESGTYHCIRNYVAIGNSTIVCLVNETWSSTDFQCIGVCPDPPPVSNATFPSSDFSVGTNVTYECQKNYVENGNPTITCQMNQEWTPTYFSCIVPAGAPQNFTATGLTETSVHLEWDLPSKKLQNGEIIMYQLVYHKLADPTDVEDLNITTLQIDIRNLEMNTDYVFQIKAYTNQGAGPWTTQLPFHTFGPILPPPENIKLTRMSATSLQVSWDEPRQPVIGYVVYYNQYELHNLDSWNKKEIGPYAETVINNMEEHAVYAVRVRAKSIDLRLGNVSEVVTSPIGGGQCPDPPQIHRASFVSSLYLVGDSLTYKCTDNYVAKGNNTVTCLDNLRWTSTDFKCIGWKCYSWTSADRNLIKVLGEYRTCTRNPRRRFTRGNDHLAPGCSYCHCCQPLE